MDEDYEEELNKLSDFLYKTDGLFGIWKGRERFLCDIVAQTYATGNNSGYLMSAIDLNTAYIELELYNKDALAEVIEYIDGKIAEGAEEYGHAKFSFSDCSFDELMEHIK